MAPELGYDLLVRGLRGAAILLFALLVTAASAQFNGVPASVTSIGFGGRVTFGVPASVTSLGPNGFQGTDPAFPPCCMNPLFPINPRPPMDGQRLHSPFFPVAVPVYTTPYMPVIIVQQSVAERDDEDGGGPTIFDRRGPRRSDDQPRYADSRWRRETREPGSREPEPAPKPEAAAPAPDQPPTVLVFRDGHKSEVKNYAILGDALYDLSSDRRRKIALADLDVAATARENDERGIDFRLPERIRTD
jgi:hypothetical protein